MKQDQPITERRRFLTLMGGGAVMLPFAGLAACSSEEPAAPTIAARSEDASATRPDPATSSAETTTEMESADVEQSTQQAAAEGEQMAQNDAGGSGASGGLPQLSEDDTQAKSLNYKHIASDVDPSKNPRYKEGQLCSNCQVYQGKEGDDWGPCAIFAGKAVKATGWCTAYAPMSA